MKNKMCKQCQSKPVYEFTNKRKLCGRCFIRYFQKKVFYIIRKFGMIKKNDVVGYENKGDFRGMVLEDVLKMFAEKARIKLVNLETLKLNSSKARDINKKQLINNPVINRFKESSNALAQGKLKNIKKIAIASTIDSESNKIINILIHGKTNELKDISPVKKTNNKIIIKPLYLFLDEEVLLYAKLKKLKFLKKQKPPKNKISDFVNELEKKHPEIKRAIINSYLKLCSTYAR